MNLVLIAGNHQRDFVRVKVMHGGIINVTHERGTVKDPRIYGYNNIDNITSL